MTTKWLVLVGILVAVIGIAAVACSDDDDKSNGNDVGAVRVRITSPEEGDVVASPVTVTIVADGIVIAPASAGQTGAAHYVVAVDGANGSLAVGEAVARGREAEGIYQTAAGSVDLELAPGDHTVVVNLADNDDVLTRGSVIAVSFTVVQ